MNKLQIIVLATGLAVLLGLYFLGPTVNPAKKPSTPLSDQGSAGFSVDSFHSMIIKQLPEPRQTYLNNLMEETRKAGNQDDKHTNLHKLSTFWKDSVAVPPLHYFYEAQLAELDNTEKSLTFAAHSILGYLPFESNHEVQHWMAGTGKQLFEKALALNANNDSTIIGIGGCIMYGAAEGESSNAMEGILKVREVAERDSTNMFAQYMLGVGGMISKQYDRAAARFERVAKMQPENLEVQFKLAEAYELAGNAGKAIACYQKIYDNVANNELKTELIKRIEALKSK
ncbi:MAG: tetratricopeptide repeat protein [Chitinophagaceae bacterium]|nr:tetratricopeptide repeat protein [Chitinophagaceae bacterium]